MFTKLKSKLTQRQKSRIKLLFSLFSPFHFKSLANHSKYGFSSKELFQQLHPVTTNLELVRLGGSLDGSYLVPLIDLKYDGVISPGVGQTFEFERAIADSSCKVVLIDGTVDKPQDLPPDFIFLQKMLGSSEKTQDSQISIEEVINRYFPTSQSLVLQMDIEGGEYEVLTSIDESDLTPFALVLVEFHHLHKLNESPAWNSSIKRATQIFMRDFLLVHTHPNNAGGFFLWRFRKLPKVVETTWIRKSLVADIREPAKLPHPLDSRNDTLMEDLVFPSFKS